METIAIRGMPAGRDSTPSSRLGSRSRLLLADLTARVLAKGLDILGIKAPERM